MALIIPEDRWERERIFNAIDQAFRAGDFEGLSVALGSTPRWFDENMPFEFGLGHPLEYAIYWSPLTFIRELLEAGSSANYVDDTGFPALFATLSTNRPDKLDILRLLLKAGAEPNQRGLNDWTPLHSLRLCERNPGCLASHLLDTVREASDLLSKALPRLQEVSIWSPGKPR